MAPCDQIIKSDPDGTAQELLSGHLRLSCSDINQVACRSVRPAISGDVGRLCGAYYLRGSHNGSAAENCLALCRQGALCTLGAASAAIFRGGFLETYFQCLSLCLHAETAHIARKLAL